MACRMTRAILQSGLHSESPSAPHPGRAIRARRATCSRQNASACCHSAKTFPSTGSMSIEQADAAGSGSHRSHLEVHSGDAAAFSASNRAASGGKAAASSISLSRLGSLFRSMNRGQSASMTGAQPPISTSQSASICVAGHRMKVADHGCLGPVNFVAGVAREEGAVAAVAGLNQVDMRVGAQLGARVRQDADERIVCRVENERGDGDAIHNTGTGSAVVVVVGVSETAIASNDLVVEVAQGAHRPDTDGLIATGKQSRLAVKAAHQSKQKSILVDTIGRLMESV